MEDVLREGLSKITVFENVFYNPMAKFNRTLGVVFLNTLGSFVGRGDLVISDIMAATGVRGIRYFLESMSVDEVYFNDVSKNAYRCMLKNISLNNMVGVSNVTAFNLDKFMSLYTGIPFDFIDIDPFGSPLPFLSPIFSNLRKKEGFLAFTATDLMTLCGVHLEALNRKYNVFMVKTDFCHELAIRILLKNIFLVASHHDYAVSSLLATFENQYVRVYIKYERLPSKISMDKLGYLVVDGEGYEFISFKDIGGTSIGNKRLLGPIWIDSYIDKSFISLMKESSQKLGEELRLEGDFKPVTKYISRMMEDDTSIPYIYRISKLCKLLRVPQPPIRSVLDSLKSMGYRSYRSFLYPDGIRTDAPVKKVLEVLKSLRS